MESFAELFEASLEGQGLDIERGSVINGTVVAIDNDWITVDTGLKSEGVVAREEFLSDDGELEVEVGDNVDVVVEAVDNGMGQTLLSREKAKRVETWNALEKLFENDEIVKGTISSKVKGGFTVDIGSVRAFLPGSLVDVRPIRDTTHLEGKELEFKVIKLDQKRNNVVVSRRAVMEAENSAEREELLNKLEEGMEVDGIVKNLTDYGAFVDLGGIDGLLHITDMAWRRIKHPSEVVEVGQDLKVKVLKFDRERNRVSLGLKQLGTDPWDNVGGTYPVGSIVKARVTNLTDYGCFAEIAEGVEGLVHVSEMDHTNKNIHPSKVVQIGDEIDVMIFTSMKSVVASAWVSNKPYQILGKSLTKNTTVVTKSLVRLSQSQTLVSLLVLMAISMAWYICLISLGTKAVKMRFVTTTKVILSKRWSYLLMQKPTVLALVLNN